MRILIADDDSISRLILKKSLMRLGHEVVEVANGEDAAAILTAEDGPRLAVLDWMMPGMDGIAVLKAVREASPTYVYMLLLTGRDGDQDLVDAMSAGADDFLNKPLNVAELRARLRSGERVLDLQSRLLQATEQLRIDSSRDHLTGLWNRAMISELLDRELKRARHKQHPLSVLLLDIDHFKSVNDTYGHSGGDDALKAVADRMRNCTRDYDFVGRYGGEEFIVLVPDCDEVRALEMAERLRAAIAASPLALPTTQLQLTVSIGVATWTSGEIDAKALVALADRGLYAAKAAGRNRVEAGSQHAEVKP